MKNIIELTGKKILVTGASSGIGRATAILLSQIGAKIVLVSRRKEELEKTLNMMENKEQHYIYNVDLSNLSNIGIMMDSIVKVDDIKLDGFVHCAGIAKTIPINLISYETLDNIMTVNYYAFLEIVKYYAKKKISNGGSIVGMSSIASFNGEKCQTVYSGSKGALDASIRPLSKELMSKGIRINTVQAGLVETEMGSQLTILTGIEEQDYLANVQPMGIIQPKDVANLIAFLLSDASRLITGRSLCIDGGRP